MHDINKDIELSKYRYSLAKQTYNNAKMCFDNGFYRDCINRSYYAVFYAIRAVLALESIDFILLLQIKLKHSFSRLNICFRC